MSALQGIHLISLLRIPFNKHRKLGIFLSKLNLNVLTSERQMRKERGTLVSHVENESVKCGLIGLSKKGTDENITNCAFVRVKNLICYIEEIM